MRNNAVQSGHFKKTSLRYKTWFNQPARHLKRRDARVAKAKAVYPRPTQMLRPAVRCPTIRHNKKLRLGRGFTPEECKAAGLDHLYARTIGIAVDCRRRNMNEEAFKANVDRLKEYTEKLVFFDTKEEAENAGAVQHLGRVMPIFKSTPTVKTISAGEIESYN